MKRKGDASRLRWCTPSQTQGSSTHFLGFSGPVENPLLCVPQVLVESEEAGLTATLDELVRLCDKLGRVHPCREVVVGRDSPGLGIPLDLGNLGRGEDERGVLGGSKVGVRGGCAFEPVSQQELGVVLADGCVGDQGRTGRGEERTNLWRT